MGKKWLGKMTCDFCETDLTKEEYFIDGSTHMGYWALMCPRCHNEYGNRMGQKYNPDRTKVCNLYDQV